MRSRTVLPATFADTDATCTIKDAITTSTDQGRHSTSSESRSFAPPIEKEEPILDPGTTSGF